MLLRLAYLTVINTFAVLRLRLMNDRDKNTEILVLRHQAAVLERQLGERRVAGINVMLTGARMPMMNAVMER